MGEIQLVRVYDADATAGTEPTYLVDRLWPRGVRRDRVRIDGWLKDIAPSPELRGWFAHDPAKWEEFHRRYTAELDANPDGLRPLIAAIRASDVTLLYSAKDRAHNNAVVLRDYLVAHRTEG